MGRTVGLNKTVIFDFTMGEVHMLQLQSGTLKCPVDVTYLTALALCKQISNVSTGRKKYGADEMECNDGETTTVKFCLHDFNIPYRCKSSGH